MGSDYIVPIYLLLVLCLVMIYLFHIVFHYVGFLKHSKAQVASLSVLRMMLMLRTALFALIEPWTLIKDILLI